MKKSSVVRKIVGIVLIGGLIITSGAIAFASTDDSSAQNRNKLFAKIAFMRKQHGPRADGQEFVNKLVEKGIISQEQADKMAAFREEKAEEMKAEREKIKDMTAEERKAYLAEKKANRPEPLSELVEAGIITQEQADEILAERPDADKQRGPKGNRQGAIDQMVEKGIISQEQADKMAAFREEKAEEMKAEREKIKDMTAEERKAYLAEKKANRPEPLSELVEAGIITQEQADQILAERPERTEGRMGKRFK